MRARSSPRGPAAILPGPGRMTRIGRPSTGPRRGGEDEEAGMRIESPGFTESDLDHYRDELIDHERMQLVARLERASARLAELGPRVTEGTTTEPEWSPNEVLAHIAVLSKFYGMLT